MTDWDREVCLCFHVTKRKLLSFLRVERPRRPSQLADCFGAGTGCGWCRPYLERLFQQERTGGEDLPMPPAEQYAAMRCDYIRRGQGVPPPGDPLRPLAELNTPRPVEGAPPSAD